MPRAAAVLYVSWCVVVSAAHAPPSTDDQHTAVPLDATTSALAYILAKANIAKELALLFPSDLPSTSEKRFQPTNNLNTPHTQTEHIQVPSRLAQKENNSPGNQENSDEKYQENNEKYDQKIEKHQDINKLCTLDICSSKSKDLNRKHEKNNEVLDERHQETYHEKHEYYESNEKTGLKHKKFSKPRENSHGKHQKKNNTYLEDSKEKDQETNTREEVSELFDRHNLPEDLVSLLNHMNNIKQTESKHSHIVVLEHKNKGKINDLQLHSKIKNNLNAITGELSAEIIDVHDSDVTSSMISQEVLALPTSSVASTKSHFEKVIDLPTIPLHESSEDKNVIDFLSETSVKSQADIDHDVTLQNFNRIESEKLNAIHTIEISPIVGESIPFVEEFVNEVSFLGTNDVKKIDHNIGSETKENIVNNVSLLEEQSKIADDSYLVEDSSSSDSSLLYEMNESYMINDEINELNFNEMPYDIVPMPETIDLIKSTDKHEYFPFEVKLAVEPEAIHQKTDFEDQIVTPLGEDLSNMENEEAVTAHEAATKIKYKDDMETIANLVQIPVAIVGQPVDYVYNPDHKTGHKLGDPDRKVNHGPDDYLLDHKTNLPLAYDNEVYLHLKESNYFSDHDHDKVNHPLDRDLKTVSHTVIQEPTTSSNHDPNIDKLIFDRYLELNIPLVDNYKDESNYHDQELLHHDHNRLHQNTLSKDLPLAYEVKTDSTNHDLYENLKSNLPLEYKDNTNNYGTKHQDNHDQINLNPNNHPIYHKHHSHKVDHILEEHTNLPVAVERDSKEVSESLPTLHHTNDKILDKHYNDFKDNASVHKNHIKLHHHHKDNRHSQVDDLHKLVDGNIIVDDGLIIGMPLQDIGQIMQIDDEIRHTEHVHKDHHHFDDLNASSSTFSDKNKPTSQVTGDILNDTPQLKHNHHHKDLHKLDAVIKLEDYNYKDEDHVNDTLTIDNSVHSIPSSPHDVSSLPHDIPSSPHDHVHISLLDVLPLLSVDADVPISSQNYIPSSEDDVAVTSSSHEVEIPILTHKGETVSLLNILSSLSNDVDVSMSSHEMHGLSRDTQSMSPDHFPISLIDLLSVSSPDAASQLHDVRSSSHEVAPVSSYRRGTPASSYSIARTHPTSKKLDDVQPQKYYQLSFVFNK